MSTVTMALFLTAFVALSQITIAIHEHLHAIAARRLGLRTEVSYLMTGPLITGGYCKYGPYIRAAQLPSRQYVQLALAPLVQAVVMVPLVVGAAMMSTALNTDFWTVFSAGLLALLFFGPSLHDWYDAIFAVIYGPLKWFPEDIEGHLYAEGIEVTES